MESEGLVLQVFYPQKRFSFLSMEGVFHYSPPCKIDIFIKNICNKHCV
jgi:O-methyltransferase involved in polyketide biosynthesis